jgi:hypothetical protein
LSVPAVSTSASRMRTSSSPRGMAQKGAPSRRFEGCSGRGDVRLTGTRGEGARRHRVPGASRSYRRIASARVRRRVCDGAADEAGMAGAEGVRSSARGLDAPICGLPSPRARKSGRDQTRVPTAGRERNRRCVGTPTGEPTGDHRSVGMERDSAMEQVRRDCDPAPVRA